jgi:hypothetical protein
VGLFDRLKSFAAPVPDADAAMPRWARITHIDREDGPLATVEMEIHYGNTPPFTTLPFLCPASTRRYAARQRVNELVPATSKITS